MLIKNLFFSLALVLFNSIMCTNSFASKSSHYDSVSPQISIYINSINSSEFPEIEVTANVFDARMESINGLTSENFLLTEDNVSEKIAVRSIEKTSSKTDIIFVLDNSGSMSDEINIIKSNISNFLSSLSSRKIDFKLGLVTFADIINPYNNYQLMDDATKFQNLIKDIRLIDGGDDPENSFDALDHASRYNLREDAKKIFVLLTDAQPHYNGDGTSFSSNTLSSITQKLNAQNIECNVVAINNPNYFGAGSLSGSTGGVWYNVRSDFKSILDRIRNRITSQYIINYTSYNDSADGTWRHVWLQTIKNNEKNIDTTGYLAPHKYVPKDTTGLYLVDKGFDQKRIDPKNILELYGSIEPIRFFPSGYYKPFIKENIGDYKQWANFNKVSAPTIKDILSDSETPKILDHVFELIAYRFYDLFDKFINDPQFANEILVIKIIGYTDSDSINRAGITHLGQAIDCINSSVNDKFYHNDVLGCFRAFYTREELNNYLELRCSRNYKLLREQNRIQFKLESGGVAPECYSINNSNLSVNQRKKEFKKIRQAIIELEY